jgi:lipopolysaccharide/colanic/teichoic acid biosynthesis glycosyltransferase
LSETTDKNALMEKRKFRIITLFADIVILIISFLAVVATKPSSFKGYVPSHLLFFVILAIVWLIVSLLNGKMHRGKVINFSTLFSRILTSNMIAISITALLMFIFRDYGYSRTVVLGTAIVATLLEIVSGSVYMSYKKANVQDYEEYEKYKKYKKPNEYELVGEIDGNGNHSSDGVDINPEVVSSIEKECGPEMAEAVIRMTGQKLTDQTAVLSTTTIFNITSLPEEKYTYIINLHKINDIKQLDRFIDSVNQKLEQKGYFFCCVETKDQRKTRILKKFPPVFNYIFYSIDFLVKRILPKLKYTRPLYFFLTRGENAVISRAEALGRLSRGGFRIKMESFIGNKLCIEARKYSDPIPLKDNLYGPLIALPRVGKNGEIIKVYKLRTMHPYSEYIQDYVYKLHDLQNGGKFKNDFRITSWGSVCRKIWLDELPMVINFFNGEMKIVGVRPLSKQYFELYKKDVQERRIRYKPGLIPPFYADMPSDLEEIQSSEMRYLDHFDKHPIITDFRYFWKSLSNILFRKARSN